MSVLDSKVNSIVYLVIDASVNRAVTANPTLYGGVSMNSIPSQPNNYFVANVTFNM